jgi:hypothetical protein
MKLVRVKVMSIVGGACEVSDNERDDGEFCEGEGSDGEGDDGKVVIVVSVPISCYPQWLQTVFLGTLEIKNMLFL